MADSRYGLAFRTAHGERISSATSKPDGENILQRITTMASKRLPSPATATATATPSPPTPPSQHRTSTSPASPRLSSLPSNPIERFSGNHIPGKMEPAFIFKIRSSGSLASTGFSKASADMPSMSSLAGRLVSDLRSRAFLPPGYKQQLRRTASGLRQEHHHQPEGLRELSSAITQVESKLSLDSSEAGQLREALKTLRSEKEAYLRERASNISRTEDVSREFDEMRRRVATMEDELGRRNGLLRRAEEGREEVQQKLSATARQLASGFRKEKERFSRETEAAEARQGERGTSIISAAAKHERDRGYRERLRTLSDGLASTQLQLSTLKSERETQKREAAKVREDLMIQIARLEAQLKRVGEGVEKERADMETVMLNLSNALSGVDVQLKQSAGMTPSREASRALRRAQEDFRRDQRRVTLLLEKQRQRYDTASSVVEDEAQ
ncbi:unnamed protein product, partial [Hapterophycus canaliculatus]